MIRILLIDDDPNLRSALAEQLELEGAFRVSMAATAQQGRDAIAAGGFDMILLDVDLPDGDGRDVCRDAREAGDATPIIMLTGKAESEDAVAGLDAGANDYVVKPFQLDVLLARIRTHLRVHEQSEAAVFEIGPYEFRPAQKLLFTKEGKRIRLTEKETSILKFLLRAGGEAVDRDTLLHEVWGYNAAVTTHTLETHVYRLRQKIEPNPKSAQIIMTESGGYRLVR